MLTQVQALHAHSVEDYLTLEAEAEATAGIRREYWNGVIVSMSGGTPDHNRITSALNALLWFALRGKPYSVFTADQRLWIPERNVYVYPDIMVLQTPIQLQPHRKDTVMNPVLIGEVLSKSTQNYDRVGKFAAYRSLAAFQEYLLIDQYRVHIEHYIRQGEAEWIFREYDNLQVTLGLASLGVEVKVSDLYGDVEFSGEADEGIFPDQEVNSI